MARQAFAHLARQDADIASALQTEMQVLSKVVNVDALAKSLKPPASFTSVPHFGALLDGVKDLCTLQRMVSDFQGFTSQLGMAVGDLATAVLNEISQTYAFNPAHVPSSINEHLAAILPQLPAWCDKDTFAVSFQALEEFSQRTLNAQAVDLQFVLASLEILRGVIDTCGRLLSTSPSGSLSGPAGNSAGAWDAPGFGTWSFGPAMLFSPPPTPEQVNSPTASRNRHNSPLANATRAARAAFDSVAADGAHGPNGNAAVPVPSNFIMPFGLDDDQFDRSNFVMPPDHQVPSQQFKERPPGFRVVMCRHMDAKGKCKKAGTCTFAHSQSDLEKFRALYIPTERCNFGVKCGKTTCKYSHSPAEQHRSIRIYIHHCNSAMKAGTQ